MKMTLPSAVAKAGVAVLAGATAVISGTATAWAVGTNAGAATIINPANGQPITNGGSQTSFTIKLPSEAACSGDTATNNFHIFSYIVDAAAYPDPGAVLFTPDGPVPNAAGDPAYNLFTDGGSPYVNVSTAIQSGFILNIPTFKFAVFSIDGATPEENIPLPARTYNVGIACANPDNTGDKYWNTQLTFTANAGDPNGEVFQVLPPPQIPDSPLTVLLPLSAAALGGAAFVTMRRRRSSSTLTTV